MSHASTYVAYKGRKVDLSREVWVYRNLRSGKKCGRWSIMQDGLVVGHAGDVSLVNARFLVREAGRQRAIRENRRNVHAFVIGTLVDSWPKGALDFWSVFYDHRKFTGFVTSEGLRPVVSGELVNLGAKCFVANPK